MQQTKPDGNGMQPIESREGATTSVDPAESNDRTVVTHIERSQAAVRGTSTAPPTTKRSITNSSTSGSGRTVETVDAATKKPAGMLGDWGVSPSLDGWPNPQESFRYSILPVAEHEAVVRRDVFDQLSRIADSALLALTAHRYGSRHDANRAMELLEVSLRASGREAR